jgi:hypothetical protein
MCIFKALSKFPDDQYHGLDLEEFQHFYEVIGYKWEQVSEWVGVVMRALSTQESLY